MPADTGFRALTHLDLNSRAGEKKTLVNPETSGSDLHDRIRPVLIEILVKSALAGIVHNSQFGRGARKRFVRVVTN